MELVPTSVFVNISSVQLLSNTEYAELVRMQVVHIG